MARKVMDGISDVATLYELNHLLSIIAGNPKIQNMDFDIVEAAKNFADSGKKEMVDVLIVFIRREYKIVPGFEKALASLENR